jgi:hypothetical protein
MPRPEQLPEDIRDLAYRNAVELTHARWKSDIKLLIRSLRSLLGDSRDIVQARGVRNSLESFVVDRSKLFGPGETSATGSSANLPSVAPAAVGGTARASQSPPAPSGIRASNTVAAPAADCGCSDSLDPSIVARITAELTDYIGPIAEVVVRRAAKKCATVAELRTTVAEEIETNAERTRFLDACRST